MKDVNEVIASVGMGKYQYVQLMMVGILYALDGAEILIASTVIGPLAHSWGLDVWMKGIFVSVIFVGVLIGNIVGGMIADAVGRKPVVLTSYTGVCICGLLSSQAVGPLSLMVSRFLFGLCYGLGTGTGITLLVESVPSNFRGHVVNLTGLFFVGGEIFACVILMVFTPQLTNQQGEEYWRYITALGVAPGVFTLPVVYFIMQESPHYLMTRGYQSEALAVLRYIAAINGKEDVMVDVHALRPSHVAASDTPLPSSGGTGEADASETTQAPVDRRVETTWWQRTSILFSGDFRYTLVGGSYILFVANMLFFGLMYGLPTIFAHMDSLEYPALNLLIVSLMDLPGVVVAWLLINSEFGHRDGLIVLAAVSMVCLLLMTTLDVDSYSAVALPASYMAKYSSAAFFTLSYVYLAEVFPSVVRSTGLSLCIGFGRLGSILAPEAFELLTGDGVYWPFFVACAVISGLSCVIIRRFLLVEHKNQPLEDIPVDKMGAPAGINLAERPSSAPLVAPATGASSS